MACIFRSFSASKTLKMQTPCLNGDEKSSLQNLMKAVI